MTDDGRGADVITLPSLNLSPPDDGVGDGDVPPPPEAGNLAPPPDFFLPFPTPGDGDDAADPDGVAQEMAADAASGTGTPARATASMAMVTMAAIAVAALRGTWSVANYLKARREHHDAVADKARSAADKHKVANAAAAAKKSGVQSGPEFGRGAAGKGGGNRPGGPGGAGGAGRGTFGQQTPASKNSGPGGRGDRGGRANGSATRSDSRTERPGSARADTSRKAAADSGSSRGQTRGAKNSPGTLGRLAAGRQQRKNDEAKANRRAEADVRKSDLADRAAERKEEAAEAAERRKWKAAKRKARLERRKADGTGRKTGADDAGAKDTKADNGEPAEKVDLTKKPGGDSPKGGAGKKPKAPKKKTRSSRRRKKKSSTGSQASQGGQSTKDHATGGPGAMPGGDGEWLRPPPGWDVAYTATIEVVRPPKPEPAKRQSAGITAGRKGLPAGSPGGPAPTRSVPRESPIVMGTAAVVGEVGDTQFVDADLTVYDLIESDEEMGDQILQGAEHMALVAAKCEGLRSGLESLYAMCIEKKVPGVLTGWCIRLMERAGSVQDKAEALRASLPRASEAILAARDTAVEADKLRADRVKEAGHVAPAEREYHDRSGA